MWETQFNAYNRKVPEKPREGMSRPFSRPLGLGLAGDWVLSGTLAIPSMVHPKGPPRASIICRHTQV